MASRSWRTAGRTVLALALVAGGLGLPEPRPVAGSVFEASQPSSRPYRRLEDWARLQGLRVERAPLSRDILVTGPEIRMALLTEASRITFNGVAVWLSHPVRLVNGEVWVAVQDLDGVLQPLIRPGPYVAGGRVRTICLDPGHGGREPGQKNGTRLEKTYTLALAEEVRRQLVRAGFQVIMTRESDETVDLVERAAIAQRRGADLLVSLHFNASPNGGSEASGVEVYALTPEGARSTNASVDAGPWQEAAGNRHDPRNLLLAYHLQRALVRDLPGTVDRGVRRARFVILRLAEMPAALVELGFMSNPSDARWIYSEAGRRQAAASIVAGLRAYAQAVERAPSPGQRITNSTSSRSNAVPLSAKN
ncbi:MAG: N-acetylmuramoyl-L-alanine amidase [Verrucomicrobiae bacterium]|nr:N-acetylmuramoyl-L-alanine amidase [Verrucomicrobiae bacterium]